MPSTPVPAPTPVPGASTDPTTAVEVWTALGTWAGAVATTLAVVVALWISHRDRRRADAERRDQEKAQARLVVSRLLPDAVNRVAVINESAAPVSNVTPEYSVTDREDGLAGAVDTLEKVPRDLGPHEQWTVPVMYLDLDLDVDGGVVAMVAVNHYYWSQKDTITITFTDNAGLRWRRVNNSEPQRVINAETPP